MATSVRRDTDGTAPASCRRRRGVALHRLLVDPLRRPRRAASTRHGSGTFAPTPGGEDCDDVSARYIEHDTSRRAAEAAASRTHREGAAMCNRGDVLELAVLGLLTESPLHGYELRKRLSSLRGAFRAFSYGSLYPCLKQLLAAGLIAADDTETRASGLTSKRAKVVYRITAEGKERFGELVTAAGPSAWEDDNFGIHFAFFGKPDAAVRMRSRLEERLATVRAALTRTRERLDRYTLELQQHGLESVEREVRWLDELIATERAAGPPRPAPTHDRSRSHPSTESSSRSGDQ